jgi:RecB family exonuclease
MDFLLYHVLELREKENVDLAVETSTLGTVIHDTLEELYKPYLSKSSDSIEVKQLVKHIKSSLIAELSKVYPASYLNNGRLNILIPVLEKWVQNFLWIDKKRGELNPFRIIELEQKLKHTVVSQDLPFKMKGVVDRLEEWKGAEHVIDYKTGKVEPRDLALTQDELLHFNPDKSKAYQLLMYTFIYRESKTRSNSLLSSIYSFRNQKSGYLPLLIDGNENLGENEMQAFRKGLTKVVKSMLNQETPIEMTNHRYQKFSV